MPCNLIPAFASGELRADGNVCALAHHRLARRSHARAQVPPRPVFGCQGSRGHPRLPPHDPSPTRLRLHQRLWCLGFKGGHGPRHSLSLPRVRALRPVTYRKEKHDGRDDHEDGGDGGRSGHQEEGEGGSRPLPGVHGLRHPGEQLGVRRRDDRRHLATMAARLPSSRW